MEEIFFDQGEFFEKRISHKPVRLFYVVIGLFLLVALLLAIFIGEDAYPAAAATGGFALLMLLLVYSQASAWSVKYYVGKEGIKLKRAWYKERISFEDLQLVKIAEEEETEQAVYEIDDKRVEAINNVDIINAFKNQIDFGKATMYSSVPFVGSESNINRRISRHSIDTDGEFICIKCKNGKQFFISPLNTQDFLSAVVKYSERKFRFEIGKNNCVSNCE